MIKIVEIMNGFEISRPYVLGVDVTLNAWYVCDVFKNGKRLHTTLVYYTEGKALNEAREWVKYLVS